MSPLPPRIVELSDLVNRRLETHLEAPVSRLHRLHPSLGPLADELRSFVSEGGKRLRPVMLLLGHELAGGDPDDVVGPALAVELLHACALLHDDVIDAADTRRGRPAVHVAFSQLHRDRGHAGDADRFGTAIAVLLGDLAFVQADEAFLDTDLPADRVLAGLRAFGRLREEVMAGQALDVLAAATRSTDVEAALTVATLKSGRYSVTRPLQLGATLAGADADFLAVLQQVGDPLGLAFQLRDDLLGVFGTEHETGKPVAGDLAEGKRTVLIAEAAARLSSEDWTAVEEHLGDPQLGEATAERIRGALRSSGAEQAVSDRIDDLVGQAREAIGRLADTPARQTLDEFSDWFVTRRA